MNALTAVVINIVEIIATCTRKAGDRISTDGVLVAVMRTGGALVNHFNADAVVIRIVVVHAVALTIAAQRVGRTLNVVASVAVAAV